MQICKCWESNKLRVSVLPTRISRGLEVLALPRSPRPGTEAAVSLASLLC